jgi:hypothetical protein
MDKPGPLHEKERKDFEEIHKKRKVVHLRTLFSAIPNSLQGQFDDIQFIHFWPNHFDRQFLPARLQSLRKHTEGSSRQEEVVLDYIKAVLWYNGCI